MNTIRSIIAGALLQAAVLIHRQAVNDKVKVMGLGGTGPWTPGK